MLMLEEFGNYIDDKTTSSFEECSEWCKQDSSCKYWSWQKDTNQQCYRLTDSSGRRSTAGVISGSRDCEGEFICTPYDVIFHASLFYFYFFVLFDVPKCLKRT